MNKQMLIDASQPEETRVVVIKDSRIEDFDYDFEAKKQLKGNIYLAKVTRVEPSLQAAFVDYGGNRHGFLAFNEIHPDYYKIPIADREKLIAEETDNDEASDETEDGDSVETFGGDDLEDLEKRRRRLRRRYKIQEVIKRSQIILVQVVKEERGNKGAALTTYLSLPGRYCVLMPNTARGGGISRKITNQNDRKRLKKVLDDFGIPTGMTVIVRTAGSERTKAEIKRDYNYLIRLWNTIREQTLQSIAPTLIYEEANLVKRAIRDLYSKEIDEVFVDGNEAYRVAKDMMKTLMPSHAKKVQPYKNGGTPLFHKYQVEGQLNSINSPEVQLRSGGSVVLHQTEALVAIDVNSGRATRERHIEETALRTNLEAAEEIARQLRLRDLAGLIVIDFIDMDENRNNHAVERRLKDSIRADRARIQVGRISHFGLLEMSRQRLRPSLTEISSQLCTHCAGTGLLRSIEWSALYTLRSIEEEAIKSKPGRITVCVNPDCALYILNHKRDALANIEERYDINVTVIADSDLGGETCMFQGENGERISPTARKSSDGDNDGKKHKRSRRRRRGRSEETQSENGPDSTKQADHPKDNESDEREGQRKRRRRGRRGGRRRGRKSTHENLENKEGQSSPGLNIDEKARTTDPVTNSLSENEKPISEKISEKKKSEGRHRQKTSGTSKKVVSAKEKQKEIDAPEVQDSGSKDTLKSGIGKKKTKASEKKPLSASTTTSADNNEKREKRTGWWNKVLN
ncbi:MAG: ribonuclease E/G [Pseudomonadota bacterium]|nr:ribonuclease E/G [Pseudomonadota bacterium]